MAGSDLDDSAIVDQLRRAGLYEPDADGAEERLALLRYNIEQGVTVDELIAADRLGRQSYVAGDPHIRPTGEPVTLDELAERAGTSVDEVERMWRAAGLTEPGRGDNTLVEADVELVRTFQTISAVLGPKVTLHLLRTVGAALARVAEAEATTFATIVGANYAESADPVELARANVAIARMLPNIATVLDVLHRRHLLATNSRLMAEADTRELPTKHLAIGFADLVGFTAWTANAEPHDLATLVEEFEARARDAVTERGGTVVKMIGDEVMFVAADEPTACEAARALLAAVATLDGLSRIRVGLAAGEVLTGYGDYYGPVVNLASRLVSKAEPGQVLVSGEVRQRAQQSWEFTSAGHQRLKGFAEPVETYELALSSP